MMALKTAVVSPQLRPMLQRAVTLHGSRPMTVLSKQSAEEYKKQNYSDRMKKTGRPVSPHVTIYAFPVGALSSITNRVTGCALSFGCFGLGALDLVGGAGTSLDLMQAIGSQGFLIAAPAKFAVSFSIMYHYFGAVRHFIWDNYPDYLNNIDVPKTSMALFGGTTALSAILALL